MRNARSQHAPISSAAKSDSSLPAADGRTVIGHGDGYVLLSAAPGDFWPLADLHCSVFFPELDDESWKGGLSRIDRLMALQMNRSLEDRKFGRATCIMAVDSSTLVDSGVSSGDDGGSTFGGSVDSTSNMLDRISSSSSSSSTGSTFSTTSLGSSSSSEPWRGPKVLLGVARWAARPEAQGALGASFEGKGLLGVAQVDSFGDVVPPKALSAKRDGAVGWIRREGICYISNVAVSSKARRRGIARRLMAEAEALAAEWGFRCVSLHCDRANTAAWQLYHELGYRRVALEAPWAPYLNGRPPNRCWLLIKRLPSAAVAAAARQRAQQGEGEGQEGEGKGMPKPGEKLYAP